MSALTKKKSELVAINRLSKLSKPERLARIMELSNDIESALTKHFERSKHHVDQDIDEDCEDAWVNRIR